MLQGGLFSGRLLQDGFRFRGGVVHADKIREVDTKIGVDRGGISVSVSRY